MRFMLNVSFVLSNKYKYKYKSTTCLCSHFSGAGILSWSHSGVANRAEGSSCLEFHKYDDNNNNNNNNNNSNNNDNNNNNNKGSSCLALQRWIHRPGNEIDHK